MTHGAGKQKMINWILMTIGSFLLLYSVIYYVRECKGNVSPTMGGDMSFGFYWSFGAVLFSLGTLPILGLSRWWSIAGYLIAMVASIPVRSAISRLFCDPL